MAKKVDVGMGAHAGAGVNDLKTHVAMTSAAAANGCATPDGGAGTVTVVDSPRAASN